MSIFEKALKTFEKTRFVTEMKIYGLTEKKFGFFSYDIFLIFF